MSHHIPWDNDLFADDEPALPTDRPAWLPRVGDGVDLNTAIVILDAYSPMIDAMLDTSARTSRQRHNAAAITVHHWTAAELVRDWSAAADGILVGFVMADDLGHRARFRDVLVAIAKPSGELVRHDASRLLDQETFRADARA